MKRHIRLMLMQSAVIVAAATMAAPSAGANDKADPVEDDILAVLDLPFAAAEATEAGVDRAELDVVLQTVQDGGLSLGEATMIIAAEADQAEQGDAKPGFGAWVRRQVADGARGRALAERIAARKGKAKPISDKEEKALARKIAKIAAKRKARRKQQEAARKAALAAGQSIVFVGKEQHERHLEALSEAKPKLRAAKRRLAHDRGRAHAGDHPGKSADAPAHGKRLAAQAGDEPGEAPGRRHAAPGHMQAGKGKGPGHGKGKEAAEHGPGGGPDFKGKGKGKGPGQGKGQGKDK